MISIQIPKLFLPGFQTIAEISSEQAGQIGDFLQQVPIGTGGKTFEKLFHEKFTDLANTSLAPAIFSLGAFTTSELNNLPFNDLVEVLTQSYAEQIEINDDSELQKLKSNLGSILSKIESLSISYKVFGLQSENSRTFKSCRIVSDIRLVFNEDIYDRQRNALIVHRLKINSVENNETKQYFFSLDTTDLKKLKEQIERAEQKDKMIKEQYKELISFITVTD